MKEVIRKKSTPVNNVTYKHGYSNILRASNISLEVNGERIVLFLDFSPNQPKGGKDTHAYSDAEEMKENFDEIEFIQMYREPWLDNGIRNAEEDAEEPAVWELECRFKDGTIRTMPARIKTEKHNFWFHRAGTPEESETDTL